MKRVENPRSERVGYSKLARQAKRRLKDSIKELDKEFIRRVKDEWEFKLKTGSLKHSNASQSL